MYFLECGIIGSYWENAPGYSTGHVSHPVGTREHFAPACALRRAP
jgi:hypothetical protein